jgi:hypothetical protein
VELVPDEQAVHVAPRAGHSNARPATDLVPLIDNRLVTTRHADDDVFCRDAVGARTANS